jgi:hypothetical protein
MSLSLVGLMPGSLRFVLTWVELNVIETQRSVENLTMWVGAYSLGLDIIGLIVLWTGFKKRERWAWFVMLVILLFYVFPGYVLTELVLFCKGKAGLSDFLQLIPLTWAGNWQSMPAIGILLGLLTFVVMLVALLLPVKAFFLKAHTSVVTRDQRKQDNAIPADNR